MQRILGAAHLRGRRGQLLPSGTRRCAALCAALSRHSVVVVPGFLATRDHRVVTLGRGGSDLSAVLLAVQLRAGRCELVKDVDGYFTADPHVDPAAKLIPSLDFHTALELAEEGCPLVQRQAIQAARNANLPIVVRSLKSEGTAVGAPKTDFLTSRLSDFHLMNNISRYVGSGHVSWGIISSI